jgi:zinc transport system substrate-binding protein
MPSIRCVSLGAVLWLGPVVLATPGCGGGDAPSSSAKLIVGVTVEPHAWLVRRIAGERADVFTMVQRGESAELYQPTDVQVSRLAGAALYFQTGMPLERSPGFAAVCSAGRTKVVDLRDAAPPRTMAKHVHADGDALHGEDRDDDGHPRAGAAAPDPHRGADPHIWMSPRLLRLQAKCVADALAEVDPDHAASYRRNLQSLEARLEQVDREIRRLLQPAAGKAFLVFHPAWGYFADDYGLREIAIEIEGKEPSDRELTAIQEQARREGLKVVFVQPQFAGRSAEAVARAIGGRTQLLDDLPADLDAALLDVARAIAEACR